MTQIEKAHTSEATRAKIVELREKNWPVAAIAAELGLSSGTVGYWCLLRGADPKKVASPRPLSGPYVRNGQVVHPFTRDDDAFIRALALQNYSHSEIARYLTKRDPARPRKPAPIKYRLFTLARHEARAERAGG